MVAEGVETQEEAAFLKMNGCFVHQGYLYSRPLLPEEFDRKYRDGEQN